MISENRMSTRIKQISVTVLLCLLHLPSHYFLSKPSKHILDSNKNWILCKNMSNHGHTHWAKLCINVSQNICETLYGLAQCHRYRLLLHSIQYATLLQANPLPSAQNVPQYPSNDHKWKEKLPPHEWSKYPMHLLLLVCARWSKNYKHSVSVELEFATQGFYSLITKRYYQSWKG